MNSVSELEGAFYVGGESPSVQSCSNYYQDRGEGAGACRVFTVYVHEATNRVAIGRCKQWPCPECGKLRAWEEQGRIRVGCDLAREGLRFITLTCRDHWASDGWERLQERWVSFTDAVRHALKLHGRPLSFYAVIEVQERGHLHIHMILRDAGCLTKGELKRMAWHCCAGKLDGRGRPFKGFGLTHVADFTTDDAVAKMAHYLTKGAGVRMPKKGLRRIRTSTSVRGRWAPASPAPEREAGWTSAGKCSKSGLAGKLNRLRDEGLTIVGEPSWLGNDDEAAPAQSGPAFIGPVAGEHEAEQA
jgi:hypothetical protein